MLAGRRQGRREGIGRLEHLDRMTMALHRIGQQGRQRCQVMGAEHHVQVGQCLHELLSVALADAAAHRDVAL